MPVLPALVIWMIDRTPRTDDAHVHADAIDVVQEVNGRIVRIAVRDVAMTGTRPEALDNEARLQQSKVQAVASPRDNAEARYQRGLASRYLAIEARQPLIGEQIALLNVNGRKISEAIALTKALGGGYRAGPPVAPGPR
ncbi:hypothetical protein DIE21_08950 [Burkholderia sp. Bp9140]|uniref:hypothetical protein n=1 Tax=Burkholderia sp. Bp9140 TaxID=2184572 RepID=UPI000F57F03D|nr:hypothetical protein [Burkholderia sp. Bp9140]RQR53874.1 hypothetical protein DIE21_08950 [Burkholderia sp. Bp9140]